MRDNPQENLIHTKGYFNIEEVGLKFRGSFHQCQSIKQPYTIIRMMSLERAGSWHQQRHMLEFMQVLYFLTISFSSPDDQEQDGYYYLNYAFFCKSQ